MPVKRRRAKARTEQITPEVLGLWRRCVEIQDAGADERFEDEGGRRGEYLHACVDLDRRLGIRPWQTGPLHVDEGDPPDWMKTEREISDWRAAQALRRQILEGARPGGLGQR